MPYALQKTMIAFANIFLFFLKCIFKPDIFPLETEEEEKTQLLKTLQDRDEQLYFKKYFQTCNVCFCFTVELADFMWYSILSHFIGIKYMILFLTRHFIKTFWIWRSHYKTQEGASGGKEKHPSGTHRLA